MTMILAYTWKDKAIIMADSRESAKNDMGDMVDYNDNQEKILPVQSHLVFAHAGLRRIPYVQGGYFDLNEVTEHFMDQNQGILTKATTEQLLRGIVTTWNGTFIESLGRDPLSARNRFSFLLARFETIDGELMPRFSTYQSYVQGHPKYKFCGEKAVIGDDECYPIITPYFNKDTEQMTFEEALAFYLEGFGKVMEKVETIGGPIDIYVLDKKSEDSYWLRRKTNA
ncbi:hypothetical protein IIC_04801 [Bacillus cereus VD021]|uniref:Uncharacterized protein n=1 Tax=Bacillus cereus VD021 TaxID=1053224 RepID=R8HBX7_BACCE|nr:hypothetical protein [Bacillus cereus]EOO70359.1 hypothetical protein IIC_04801 [Bacillus cereus VD021]